MRSLAFIPLLLFSACDTPKIGFNFDAVKQVSVDGHDFKVYSNTTAAQAVRLNRVGLRQRQAAADAGVVAIVQATGCKIKRIDPKSDPVLIIARLKC